MLSYNITTKISWTIANEWLRWQKEEHIPEMMSSGLFDNYNVYRLIEQDDPEGPTYIIQYFTSTEKKYKTYVEEFSLRMREKEFEKWNDQFIAHRTIMELVQ
ncbi:MAG: DUF4286 family protein [Bacteroidetes bacterium]|nr:DUF4286 family protein [Bacteroidota bacterium]